MNNVYTVGFLPKTLTVLGKEYDINSDFRCAISCLIALQDTDLTTLEKYKVLLTNIYKGFYFYEQIEFENAIKQAFWFLDCGIIDDNEDKNQERNSPLKSTMDWEQDCELIFAGINSLVKDDVREREYLHWWSFMGFFREMGECSFNTVRGVREKLANNKKLEKWEKEYYSKNVDVIKLKKITKLKELKYEEDRKEIFGNNLKGILERAD